MSDKKLKIFVTRRWPEAAEDALRIHFEPTFNMSDVPLDKAALMDGFASHDIAAPTVSDKIDADIIAAGAKGNCRLIANYGVGVNHIDVAAAAAEAIPVTNTPGVLTDATADLTLTLMLMLCRRAGEGERRRWTFCAHVQRREPLLGDRSQSSVATLTSLPMHV